MEHLIVVISIAIVVSAIHRIKSKWKSTFSLLATLLGIWGSFLWSESSIKSHNEAAKEMDQRSLRQLKLMLNAYRQREELISDHVTAAAKHDSILAKITMVDSCIDKHFRALNRRLDP